MRRTWPRLGVAVMAALVVICLGLACGGHNSGRVEGLVVDAVGKGILEIETFSIRDADGQVWTFTTDGPIGFTASHLRQHQVLGQSVVVEYVKAGGRLIATDVKDAPP